ncbi:FtsB family cell division protein [Sphingomonas sp. 1P08PE]|uniref:FtsB family cell division protein n=1 Tax=Sphingomonas sp. 1P08PE TaxID=554122 RepID=UPI0039A2136A
MPGATCWSAARGVKKPSAFRRTLRRAAIPALVFTVMAFFGAYAVLGPNGVLAYGDYKRQLAKRERDFAVLDKRREVLRNRVALLDPDHANPDMVDEMVRKELNVTHPDEVIVPLR